MFVCIVFSCVLTPIYTHTHIYVCMSVISTRTTMHNHCFMVLLCSCLWAKSSTTSLSPPEALSLPEDTFLTDNLCQWVYKVMASFHNRIDNESPLFFPKSVRHVFIAVNSLRFWVDLEEIADAWYQYKLHDIGICTYLLTCDMWQWCEVYKKTWDTK